MRILFDQGTPVPLRKLLNPHQVETAFERGWSTLTNGELLAAAVNQAIHGASPESFKEVDIP